MSSSGDLPLHIRLSGGQKFTFTDEYRDAIFTTDLYKYDKYEKEQETLDRYGLSAEPEKYISGISENKIDYLDQVNTYSKNSYGYRSPEFTEGTPLVYAGCSFTFGLGVPEETIWGTQVANALGINYANIALPGRSIQWIVKNLFSYFKKFGNPETLICLFPDFQRMTLPLNNQIIVSNLDSYSRKANHLNVLREIHLYRSANLDDRPKYSEKPHFAEDVLPVELPTFISIQSILMLEQYCASNNIKFLWSTWDPGLYEFLVATKEAYGYTSFVDLEVTHWVDKYLDGYKEMYHSTVEERNLCHATTCACAKDCHLDLLNKYGDNFYRGMDNLHGDQTSHFGIHKHTHFAEAFIKALKDIDEP